VIWFNEKNNLTQTVLYGLNSTYSVFATINGAIYADNGKWYKTVNKGLLNSNSSIAVMDVEDTCYSLFVDIDDSLYCSIYNYHKVIKKLSNSSSNISTLVAGNGCSGLTTNMLYQPMGIFVHINRTLYVADSGNDRVQFFKPGESDGITIAGNGAPETISLNCPSGVVLDGNSNLFIVDSGNHRIVTLEPTGFRCVVGCSGKGSASNQLNTPQSMAFDSYGNMFVTDTLNNRIQKFFLLTNSYSKFDNRKSFFLK
jgi:sugar lactone lactonase YvrE